MMIGLGQQDFRHCRPLSQFKRKQQPSLKAVIALSSHEAEGAQLGRNPLEFAISALGVNEQVVRQLMRLSRGRVSAHELRGYWKGATSSAEPKQAQLVLDKSVSAGLWLRSSGPSNASTSIDTAHALSVLLGASATGDSVRAPEDARQGRRAFDAIDVLATRIRERAPQAGATSPPWSPGFCGRPWAANRTAASSRTR